MENIIEFKKILSEKIQSVFQGTMSIIFYIIYVQKLFNIIE